MVRFYNIPDLVYILVDCDGVEHSQTFQGLHGLKRPTYAAFSNLPRFTRFEKVDICGLIKPSKV